MNIFSKNMFLLCSFIFSSSVTQALDITLPTTTNVHNLAIETEENVNIQVSGEAFLQGSIKSDGRITITGDGSRLTLNPTLVIDGYLTDTPDNVTINGTGDLSINTPIETGLQGVTTWPRFSGGHKLYINADILSKGHLSLTGGTGGTVINSGVTVKTDATFYSDNYGANFSLLSGATLSTKNSLGILAGAILVDGVVETQGPLQLNGYRVELNTTVNQTAPGGDVYISGVNARADQNFYSKSAVITGKLNVFGVDINNYEEGSSGVFYITASEVNGFGGSINGYKVCVSKNTVVNGNIEMNAEDYDCGNF